MIDTNVILDYLIPNKTFADTSEQVIALADNKQIEAMVCATAITNTFYILRKLLDKKRANDAIDIILEIFSIGEVNGTVLRKAKARCMPDFEDAVIIESAIAAGAELIVTRDKGFAGQGIRVLSPSELVAVFV
jgi:putative PIN family toxin of toxin-antitoxin system